MQSSEEVAISVPHQEKERTIAQVYIIELVAAFGLTVGFLAYFYNAVVFSLHMYSFVVLLHFSKADIGYVAHLK